MRLRRRSTSFAAPHSPDAPADAPGASSRRPRLLVLGAAGALVVGVLAASYVVLGDGKSEAAAPLHVTGSTPIDLPYALTAEGLAAGEKKARRQARRAEQSSTESDAPRRLVIPTLGVSSAVVPIAAPNGTLTPPDDAQQVGWWSAGAEPGAETGSALVTGHTLSRGGGALQDLETLEEGDRMSIETADGSIDYRVSDVRIFSKGTVAQEATELFSQTSPGRLVVITCEDFNGEVYLSNVVVTALPVGTTSAGA